MSKDYLHFRESNNPLLFLNQCQQEGSAMLKQEQLFVKNEVSKQLPKPREIMEVPKETLDILIQFWKQTSLPPIENYSTTQLVAALQEAHTLRATLNKEEAEAFPFISIEQLMNVMLFLGIPVTISELGPLEERLKECQNPALFQLPIHADLMEHSTEGYVKARIFSGENLEIQECLRSRLKISDIKTGPTNTNRGPQKIEHTYTYILDSDLSKLPWTYTPLGGMHAGLKVIHEKEIQKNDFVLEHQSADMHLSIASSPGVSAVLQLTLSPWRALRPIRFNFDKKALPQNPGRFTAVSSHNKRFLNQVLYESPGQHPVLYMQVSQNPFFDMLEQSLKQKKSPASHLTTNIGTHTYVHKGFEKFTQKYSELIPMKNSTGEVLGMFGTTTSQTSGGTEKQQHISYFNFSTQKAHKLRLRLPENKIHTILPLSNDRFMVVSLKEAFGWGRGKATFHFTLFQLQTNGIKASKIHSIRDVYAYSADVNLALKLVGYHLEPEELEVAQNRFSLITELDKDCYIVPHPTKNKLCVMQFGAPETIYHTREITIPPTYTIKSIHSLPERHTLYVIFTTPDGTEELWSYTLRPIETSK